MKPVFVRVITEVYRCSSLIQFNSTKLYILQYIIQCDTNLSSLIGLHYSLQLFCFSNIYSQRFGAPKPKLSGGTTIRQNIYVSLLDSKNNNL